MSSSTSTRELIPEKLQDLLRSRMQRVQMLPGVAVQALEIARDSQCSIREFVAVVERDGKLASDILKMANSAMFSNGPSAIASLHQAIGRLGFRQCRNLILSASMTSLMKTLSLEEEWIRDLLCRHGFLTSLLAMGVNRVAGVGFQGEEFAAGLIHDFGRMIIATCLPDQFSSIDPLDFLESQKTLDLEKLVVGADHCEIGSWFAELNRLPAEFVEVTRFHHRPEAAPGHCRLVSLISACDHMANFIHRNESIERYDLKQNSAMATLESCGVTNAVGRLQEACYELMTQSKRDAQALWSF